jgi:hypothetical protein
MTNDTIDHDVKVTHAAIARLPRDAAVGTAAHTALMRIMRILYLRAHSRIGEDPFSPQ